MIERGHEHKMSPISMHEPGDGTKMIHYRCEAQQPTPQNPTPCAMEEQRIYRIDDGVLVQVKVRLHGVWFHPYDLIRSMPLSTQECSACHGENLLTPCSVCEGLGLEAYGGGPLVAPGFRVVA